MSSLRHSSMSLKPKLSSKPMMPACCLHCHSLRTVESAYKALSLLISQPAALLLLRPELAPRRCCGVPTFSPPPRYESYVSTSNSKNSGMQRQPSNLKTQQQQENPSGTTGVFQGMQVATATPLVALFGNQRQLSLICMHLAALSRAPRVCSAALKCAAVPISPVIQHQKCPRVLHSVTACEFQMVQFLRAVHQPF